MRNKALKNRVAIIPTFKECIKGCHMIIRGLGKAPVMAVLDSRVYHFLNTGEPYMLRTCPKCDVTTLIIP